MKRDLNTQISMFKRGFESLINMIKRGFKALFVIIFGLDPEIQGLRVQDVEPLRICHPEFISGSLIISPQNPLSLPSAQVRTNLLL